MFSPPVHSQTVSANKDRRQVHVVQPQRLVFTSYNNKTLTVKQTHTLCWLCWDKTHTHTHRERGDLPVSVSAESSSCRLAVTQLEAEDAEVEFKSILDEPVRVEESECREHTHTPVRSTCSSSTVLLYTD